MFFQAAGETQQNEEKIKRISDLLDDAANNSKKLSASIEGILGGTIRVLEQLGTEAEQLNKQFVGTRDRLGEMYETINKSAPAVARLGGEYADVRKTIAEIAEGSRRQVIASDKQISQLFAAGEILGKKVNEIVSNFAEVGYSYDKVSTNLEKSISYVQSLGLNARAVMGDVLKNADAISRFNFNDGVLGFTKMAAQASMLRIDMQKTLQFADNLLDPDKAVETAAQFQRLGISIGNLTDPFQLMNQSLRDPSGLQDSLTNALKSFTYFDEKTKSFRVSEDGILKMRELADTTGMSASELRKTALAAAELDSKVQVLNRLNLGINATEDQKKLVANIARMGEGGQYEVAIKDDKGEQQWYKLGELTSEQFESLAKQQADAPKTLEEIQSRQLNAAESMSAKLSELVEYTKTSVFGMPGVQQSMMRGFDAFRNLGGVMKKSLDEMGFKTYVDNTGKEIREIMKDSKLTTKEKDERINELIGDMMNNLKNDVGKIADRIGRHSSDVVSSMGGYGAKLTEYGRQMLPNAGAVRKSGGGKIPVDAGTPGEPGIDYTGILGNPTTGVVAPVTAARGFIPTTRGNVDLTFTNPELTINLNVNGVNGFNERALTDVLSTASTPLKENIYKAVQEIRINKGEVKA